LRHPIASEATGDEKGDARADGGAKKVEDRSPDGAEQRATDQREQGARQEGHRPGGVTVAAYRKPSVFQRSPKQLAIARSMRVYDSRNLFGNFSPETFIASRVSGEPDQDRQCSIFKVQAEVVVFDIQPQSLEQKKVDVTDYEAVRKAVAEVGATTLLHCVLPGIAERGRCNIVNITSPRVPGASARRAKRRIRRARAASSSRSPRRSRASSPRKACA
jgi:hypothetical protein